jgi:hypothetical protein
MNVVYPRFYVGHEEDFYALPTDLSGWRVVQAARHPFYWDESKGEDHGVILTGHRLILDMVDADSPEYFQAHHFILSAEYIFNALNKGKKVLVHCNLGQSRAPSLALFCMATLLKEIPRHTFCQAAGQFGCLYPDYNPGHGLIQFLGREWDSLVSELLNAPPFLPFLSGSSRNSSQ